MAEEILGNCPNGKLRPIDESGCIQAPDSLFHDDSLHCGCLGQRRSFHLKRFEFSLKHGMWSQRRVNQIGEQPIIDDLEST